MNSAPIDIPVRPPPSKLAAFAADIKIGHTVFALPFALLSAFLAADGWPRPGVLGLILVCMVTARTVAMAANRLLDAPLDALNPRTARRAIPSGTLSRAFVGSALALCAAIFLAAASLFWFIYHNPLPPILAVPVLAFLSAYPFLKRFTRLCHYYLGAALALAPVCAWIAIRGDLRWPPIIMAGAVLSWTAGFDIIYACQDYAADVACGVFSVPAKIGIANALWVARLTHACSAALLITLGLRTPQLGTLYFIGVAVAILLLIVEHTLVKPDDLSKVGLAFFTVNGIISVLLGLLGIINVLLHHHVH
jgi:4-hydroxybenzoate polyprenyltransferase